MVDNNRAIALTLAACLGRNLGTGNIAHTRTHYFSNGFTSDTSLAQPVE
ncbi:hypothetical protein GCM10011382_31470 [Vreelandella lutescens]|uniref:Uncharacterized protein n=1 Tax=Vreelandella lutescens TaxID=1602943 RepID=A0ABQ1PKZ6_9GAMM|nr:hypothetical protein GCM10011382_31470 [Halomonas lutescens]